MNVSLDKLLTGSIRQWEVKVINVVSTHANPLTSVQRAQQGTKSVRIYPSVTGCERITSRDVCIVAPMCIFCATSSTYRLLRGINTFGSPSSSSSSWALNSSSADGDLGHNVASNGAAIEEEEDTSTDTQISTYDEEDEQELVISTDEGEDRLQSMEPSEQALHPMFRKLYSLIVPQGLNQPEKTLGNLGGSCVSGYTMSVSNLFDWIDWLYLYRYLLTTN